MRFIILFFLLLASTQSFSQTSSNTLRPFSTDGCSNVPDFNIVHCCIDHDIAYWQGGTYDQRLHADEALKQCISNERDGDILAIIFYYGVRVGGGPNSRKPYRWGYGWKHQMSYRELTSEEKAQVERLYPVNPYEMELSSDSHIEILPSPNGNYCLDEVQNYIHSIRHTLGSEISDIKINYRTKSNKRIIETTINDSTKLIFRYKPNQWNKCTKPHYGEVLPNFFYKVVKL